jgi:hypothetical protein
MAGFQTKTFTKHDDYMTPKSAWEAIAEFIPDNKTIWDPFFGDGASGEILQEIKPTCEIIHNDEDFFTSDPGTYSVDLIVTNPPFSKSKDVLNRLKLMGLPFIMILPSSKICTQYFRKLFENDDDPIQIIIPRKRIHFKKLLWDEETEEWKEPLNWKNCCNFDCFYYCWKMNLPRDIVWLK